ncbi:MAG: 50S ribosomal protein L9 [Actinobacteria bacterium]|jgi:large subunit ribosomal protein L9|nr:50S ribosomal protein L9 [Actinomycetota bacterium]NBP54541.1 50S ribosomal protein L9 [Actinomycetota bacterium]
MNVILRSDVKGLGKRGDVVSVSDGHARNFLLPRGLAIGASEGAVAQAAAMRKARDNKERASREAAQEVASRLGSATVSVTAKAGNEGRLFGSVTTTDLAKAIAAQTGIEVDKRDIEIDAPIRTVGRHSVSVRLFHDVSSTVSIDVAAG